MRARLLRLSFLFLTALFAASPSLLANAKEPRLETSDAMIPSGDAGIQLFVRNKHLAGRESSPDKILLFVHGATYPAETAFDLPIEGVSMMDLIAMRGYDVYLVDVRGYGRSTRPPEMSQPPEANKPIVSTKVAAHDLGAAVDYILHKRKVSQDQPDGLVVGHFDRRLLHQRAQRQDREARALRAAVDSQRAGRADVRRRWAPTGWSRRIPPRRAG